MNDFITIPLSKKGKYAGMYEARVSPQDSDLAATTWTYNQAKNGAVVYARSSDKKNRKMMHVIILERILGRPLAKGEECDHIDNNGLNNCRKNLRLATRAQNMANRKAPSSNKTGFKGVTWRKDIGRYQARIQSNKVPKSLGFFDTPEEAYAAYCEAADKYHQDFANKG